MIRKQTRRRGYSLRTTATYIQCVKQFFASCKKDPKEVTRRDVEDYLDSLLDRGVTGNTLNVHLHALKFLFEQVLGKRITFKIKPSRKPKRLPVFLSRQEVLRLFASVANEKHRLILELLYSAGLRVSEVVRLRRQDLDMDQFVGWVRQGKGKKDRPFLIARCLAQKLKAHIANHCPVPDSFLFRGYHNHLSTRAVQEIINHAARKARIDKRVHPHALRHSFATHLIEDGHDVEEVQPLLGHASAKTTMIYVHMASPTMLSMKSPYDTMSKEG